jgi:hypothetical protein
MRRKLLLLLLLLGLAAMVFLPRLYRRELLRMGTRPVDSLQTIYEAQVLYARSHSDKVFAPSLAELGPSPGAELIDSVLASGRKSGYVYTLNAATPDASGRITHYTLVVRPEKYSTESPSLFMDETGIQHLTIENRNPTVNDPVRRPQ